MRNAVLPLVVAFSLGHSLGACAADSAPAGSVFAKPNLVAWCIVPFDTAKRTPSQRAEMLQRLGIARLAYDWRAEHVPTFEDEIVQLKQRNIDYFAFWGFHPSILPLFEKHKLAPQFWATVPSPKGEGDAKVDAAAQALLPNVKKALQLGSAFGLYNHGGWGGEPASMVAVTKRLRELTGSDRIGIVYNFHHGHEHMADFADCLAAMQPYLLCINLNGMNDNAQPKILPIGAGQHERKMMETIARSGYRGPIGILGHRADMDAEVALRQNLDGLKKLLAEIGDQAALNTY